MTSSAPTLRTQLQRQSRAMASYVLARGKAVPPDALRVASIPATNDDVDLLSLATAHDELVRAVAPATPEAIEALRARSSTSGDGSPVFNWVRGLSVVAIGSLGAVIGFGAMHAALGFGSGYDADTGDLVSLKHFAVANGLFLSLATLGSSFQALMSIQRRLDDMTLDLRRTSDVGVRLMLGVVSGVLLATYLDLGATDPAGSSPGGTSLGMARPLLALLGGFASDVVYRVLDTLTKSVASALDRNADDVLALERGRAQLQLQRSSAEQRHQSDRDLMDIQRAVVAGASHDELQRLVDAKLTGAESSTSPGATEPSAPSSNGPDAPKPSAPQSSQSDSSAEPT